MQQKFEKVPIRLSDEERETLKVLNAALKVSEYTDDVDGFKLRRTNQNVANKESMNELFTTITGMMLAANLLPKSVKDCLASGKSVLVSDVEPMLNSVFEIGRRFKQLNPREMTEYGKLLMVLQDITRLNVFVEPHKPIKTVGSSLGNLANKFFADIEVLMAATDPMPSCKDSKNKAISEILDRVESPEFKKLFEQCIKSVDDQRSFVQNCTHPIDKLIQWLEEFGNGPSLEITAGKGGACFTHSHSRHLQYVKESLTLWRIIQRDIFDFWSCVEKDMIIDRSGANYRFVDTGQGYHRMSEAPESYNRMSKSIAEAQHEMGGEWVGIKVVHLGDRDVPNPLVFIDKYTVIPRMLTPIVKTVESLDVIFDSSKSEDHPGIRNFLKSKYGTAADLKRLILRDFFRFGFDGSGDDGGSCIDGRLTSAWNWCSQLHKKEYFDAFTLTGFLGFD